MKRTVYVYHEKSQLKNFQYNSMLLDDFEAAQVIKRSYKLLFETYKYEIIETTNVFSAFMDTSTTCIHLSS